MSIHTPGGPAFPPPNGIHDGMTLRDYFAAAALPAMLGDLNEEYRTAKDWNRNTIQQMVEFAANRSYLAADAMLVARERD